MGKTKQGKYKKIIQMLPILSYGDAIGNEVMAVHHMLEHEGYCCEIYAHYIDPRIKGRNLKNISKYKDSNEVLVLYHLSTGSFVNKLIVEMQADVVIWYHNITPPSFFKGFDRTLEEACRVGLQEAENLHSKPIMCIADSSFNKQDLLKMGYTCPIRVIPILYPFDDLKEQPDQSILKQYHLSEVVNIIFTGRVAPNKKQQDLIRAFYYYHHYYNPNSVLHIVGSYQEEGLYYKSLVSYVDALDMNDSVHFTGHIPFNQILSYYKLADIFLCLSEHEGFCVPLLESMFFHVPIIAYNSTAVGDTLGKAGLLLDDKSPELVAESIHFFVENPALRGFLVDKGTERLKYFEHSRIKDKLLQILTYLCDNDN